MVPILPSYARCLRSRTGHRRSRLWTGTFLPLLSRPRIGCPVHWGGCSRSNLQRAHQCCQTMLALLCCALGLHRVTVREIAGNSVKVGTIEAIDGTPVVDIKPVLSTSADS